MEMTGAEVLAKLRELNPELAEALSQEHDLSMFNESMTLVCEQSQGTVITESGAILFPEDAPEGEFTYDEAAHNTAVKELAARYEFKESPAKLNIPMKRHEMYESIEENGSEPFYVVFEMPSGHSRRLSEDTIKRNDAKPKKSDRHRIWPKEVMWSFAEQIRQRNPVGYAGHATIFDFSTIPENIPIQWETAVKAIRKSDGVGVTLARGYVYEHGSNRKYIRTGAINSASVFAVGDSEIDDTDKRNPVVRIKSAALISFDLVRKNTHGIPGTRQVAGMSGGNLTQQESAMEFTAEVLAILAGLTSEQLQETNPALFHELTSRQSGNDSEAVTRLVEQVTKLQTRNVGHQFDAERAQKAAEVLGCTTEQLPGRVAEFRDANDALVSEAITSCVSKLKSETLKNRITKQLRESGITDPTVVKSKFEELVALHVEIGKEVAAENGLGAVSGTESESQGGGDYVAEWLTA